MSNTRHSAGRQKMTSHLDQISVLNSNPGNFDEPKSPQSAYRLSVPLEANLTHKLQAKSRKERNLQVLVNS